MSTKHTRGPWTNHGRIAQPGLPHSAVAANTLLARVYSEAFGDSEQETANANLIAAAPELLEALQAVVSVADRATVEFDMARAAIAKATGQ
ncbi:hypothetical protein [Caballeronia sp. INDeC2]|uniref:hypothetical protein n=1 Tax=Caballeronia sp. INDeC2 TaxID=2921747 RepID=UPI0020298C36|nr:hypothetical protein [Caballeronia sp. INDeC2]